MVTGRIQEVAAIPLCRLHRRFSARKIADVPRGLRAETARTPRDIPAECAVCGRLYAQRAEQFARRQARRAETYGPSNLSAASAVNPAPQTETDRSPPPPAGKRPGPVDSFVAHQAKLLTNTTALCFVHTNVNGLVAKLNPRTAGGLSHLRTAGGGAHMCPPPPPANSQRIDKRKKALDRS